MIRKHHDIFDVRMKIIKVLDRALLASDTGSNKDAVWLPLSQIEVDGTPVEGTYAEISMPQWLAEEKGLV